MRDVLRSVLCAVLVLDVTLALPSAAAAQTAETMAEEGLSKLSDLQTAAEQLASQQGRFAGRSVGPKFGSATNSLLQVLLNFDIWACGSAVTALGIKHRQLVVEAANAIPADPALDQAVSELGNLIAQLQELCNRYVYDAGLSNGSSTAAGTGSAGATPVPVEEPTPPTMSVQERICYNQCHELYVAYVRAEFEYDRARRAAEQARSRATSSRHAADQAAERARQSEQRSEERQRERERLRRIIEDPKSSSSDRAAAAEAYGKIREGAEAAADPAREAADKAAAEAARAEADAARAEAQASALYDALLEIYQAWERCARNCARQAKLYDRVDINLHDVFPGMPSRSPSRPQFYRPPSPPAASPARAAKPAATSVASHVVSTPLALSGGTLAGAVFGDDGEPREDQRIAITRPDGSRTQVRTDRDGRFSLSVPDAAGTLALAIPGSAAKPLRIEVLDSVPDHLPRSMPDFVAVGSPVTVGSPYRSVLVASPAVGEVDLPLATAVGPDGVSGITSFTVPVSLGTGPKTVRTIGLAGEEAVAETVCYGFVNAWIEQEKLRSGQSAAFGYELDFGTGPMTVSAVVTTEGPIVYGRAGQPQLIEVDAQGKARLTGQVRALKGSPTGIPFAIHATFSREAQQSE